MVKEATRLSVQRFDSFHIVGTQVKIENVEVFFHSLLPNGLGNGHDTPLS